MPTQSQCKKIRKLKDDKEVEGTRTKTLLGQVGLGGHDGDNAPKTLIEKTRTLFSSRTAEPISDEEAKSIIRNMASFFSVLSEWEASSDSSVGLEVSKIEDV